MARTKNLTIKAVTDDYLNGINVNNPPKPADIQADILEDMEKVFAIENAARIKDKWKCPDKLNAMQIADIMLKLYPIRRINLKTSAVDDGKSLLTIYQSDGEKKGLYVEDEEIFWKIAQQYSYGIQNSEFQEILNILRRKAPLVMTCDDMNMIAVNNGIFDYRNKVLLDFTPDMVFLSKSRVNFNAQARNVVIHNDTDNTDWDVESWMDDLFDDPELVELMWKILGAIIRPNVPWDKSAWFYSESGNNGKGTLCELMRQLCGEGTYTSIPLSDFGKDFMLEPLTHASAIIVDENDVGIYIDKAAYLKAVITGDVIQLNRKFKTPISLQFKGFMVQCLNEMPRIKDKTESFYRRQLFVPFTKCFTGAERKYIKHDYLHRTEVLEYVLYKVLMLDYYELPVPKACKEVLDEYKKYNDPVRQFMSEIMGQLVWDLVPFKFLYELYNAWYKKNMGGDNRSSAQAFKKELLKILKEYPDWKSGGDKPYRPANRMDKPEPLIAEYELKDWMNPMFISSNDVNKKCIPVLKATYNGILRV